VNYYVLLANLLLALIVLLGEAWAHEKAHERIYYYTGCEETGYRLVPFRSRSWCSDPSYDWERGLPYHVALDVGEALALPFLWLGLLFGSVLLWRNTE